MSHNKSEADDKEIRIELTQFGEKFYAHHKKVNWTLTFFMGAVQSFFALAAFFIIMDRVFIPSEEEKLKKGFVDYYD